LASEALTLATFSCQKPWLLIVLLVAGVVPPLLELRARRKPLRVYCLFMGLFVALLVGGQWLLQSQVDSRSGQLFATGLLTAAILLRSGIFPLHGWMADLFEHATFGTALLFTIPLVGVYAAIRLVLPTASSGMLETIGFLSLVTAVYAAGLALVQTDVRRFFCCLVLSHAALVFVGLASISAISVTGALCVWLSASLSLGGLGLTLRAIESRCGRLPMNEHQGLYDHTPNLATFFALTGLASVGFPGTFGFVGTELLVDGAVEAFPHIGIAVVIAAALAGIALIRAYFLLFTGTNYVSSVSLKVRPSERYSVLGVAALILLGGLVPQPNIVSRYHASEAILGERKMALEKIEPSTPLVQTNSPSNTDTRTALFNARPTAPSSK
jgi:NADH-quinone oxidoreductase subunit M